MKNKIASLACKRRSKKPRSADATAEAAARLFLDSLKKDLKEPHGLASGGVMSAILQGSDNADDDRDPDEASH